MIEKFNRNNLQTLRQDIQEALDVVAEKHGLKKVSLGNINFSAEEFTSKVTAQTSTAKSEEEKLQEEAVEMAKAYGIEPAFIGQKLSYGGKNYVLKHFKPNNKKYPVICNCPDNGQQYKLPVSMFKQIIQANEG